MDYWYQVNLGDAMLADARLDAITSLFRQHYQEAGEPADMALYLRHESEGRLHCDTVLYLSPACSQIASELDAVTCPAPVADGLSLLAGSARSQFSRRSQ